VTQGQSLTCNSWDGVTRNLRSGWCRCCCFGADPLYFGAGVTANGAGAILGGEPAPLQRVEWHFAAQVEAVKTHLRQRLGNLLHLGLDLRQTSLGTLFLGTVWGKNGNGLFFSLGPFPAILPQNQLYGHFYGYGPPHPKSNRSRKPQTFPKDRCQRSQKSQTIPGNWQTFHAQEADHPHKKSSNLRVGVAASLELCYSTRN